MQESIKLEKLTPAQKYEAVTKAVKRGETISFYSDRDDPGFHSVVKIPNPKLATGWKKPLHLLLKCPEGGSPYEVAMSEILGVGDLWDDNVDALFNNPF